MSSIEDQLRRPREHIDEADKRIIDALEERMDVVVKEIKPLKKNEKGEQLEPRDEKRFDEVLDTRASMGSKLNPSFVRELFRLIIKESERLQK